MNFTNEDVIQRITAYVENEMYAEAEVLATICDHLEECYAWEVSVMPRPE